MGAAIEDEEAEHPVSRAVPRRLQSDFRAWRQGCRSCAPQHASPNSRQDRRGRQAVSDLKRNILYLGPCRGGFRVTFVLGDKAVEAERHSTLPRTVVRIVEEGKRYPI